MVNGVDIDRFIHEHCRDPYEFLCRVKVDRRSRLMIGETEVQRVTRYYVATNGQPMCKESPPVAGAVEGGYKRRNGITDRLWTEVNVSLPPDTWDERIHTKNRSRYETRETSIESGLLVNECNDIRKFNFETVNYDWYATRAAKLVVGDKSSDLLNVS